MPSLAWVPLFILWLGILETPKVTLIAVGVFFPVYIGVAGAIASVDRKLIEVGRIFRLSKLQLARRILLPRRPACDPDRPAHRPRPRLPVSWSPPS